MLKLCTDSKMSEIKYKGIEVVFNDDLILCYYHRKVNPEYQSSYQKCYRMEYDCVFNIEDNLDTLKSTIKKIFRPNYLRENYFDIFRSNITNTELYEVMKTIKIDCPPYAKTRLEHEKTWFPYVCVVGDEILSDKTIIPLPAMDIKIISSPITYISDYDTRCNSKMILPNALIKQT